MEILLENTLAWMDGGVALNFVFLTFAIASIALSIYLYFKSKKSKKPVYLEINFPLIEDSVSAIDGLDIKYNKQNINRLTLTKFSFWNNGRETIDGNDVAIADRLRICNPSRRNTDTAKLIGEFISAKVTFARKKANNFKIDIENNEAYISFGFLDFGDGAIFEIYHTGAASSQLAIKGTLKGAHKIKRGEYTKDYLTNKVGHVIDKVYPFPIPEDVENPILKAILISIMVAIFLPFLPIIMISLAIDSIARYFHKVPKEYELSDDSPR